MEKLQAIKSMRSTGKFNGGGGLEAVVVNEKFGVRLTDIISPSERIEQLK